MKAFGEKYEDRIHGVLSCFDRMLFRGYLPIMWGWSMAPNSEATPLFGSGSSGLGTITLCGRPRILSLAATLNPYCLEAGSRAACRSWAARQSEPSTGGLEYCLPCATALHVASKRGHVPKSVFRHVPPSRIDLAGTVHHEQPR
jgi:hypothetical protein